MSLGKRLFIASEVILPIAPVTTLSVTDTTIDVGDTLSGSFSVSDVDSSATVTWTLTYNGSTIASGTGDVTNQSFSGVASGSAGTRDMVLTATDPQSNITTSTKSITVSALPVNVAITMPSITTTSFTGTLTTGLSFSQAQNTYKITISSAQATAISKIRFSFSRIRDIFPINTGDTLSSSLTITGPTSSTTFSGTSTNDSAYTIDFDNPSAGTYEIYGTFTVGANTSADDQQLFRNELTCIAASGYTLNGVTAVGSTGHSSVYIPIS